MILSRLQFALVLLLTAVIAAPALAAKKDKAAKDPTAGLQKKLQQADLPAETKEKANKVVAEYAPKLREAQTAVSGALTAEQKSAKAAAEKEAKDSGKKKKDAARDIAAAMKLTPEQKEKYAAAQRQFDSAQASMNEALRGVLTADQQAKVGLKTKGKMKNA